LGKNILIPLTLLERINGLLDYWDVSAFDSFVRDEYDAVKLDLDGKLHKLKLRDAYSKIIQAKDENARHSARMEYLWQKNYFSDF